jgi:hypothetical protein
MACVAISSTHERDALTEADLLIDHFTSLQPRRPASSHPLSKDCNIFKQTTIMRFACVLIMLSLGLCGRAQSDKRISEHIRKNDHGILREMMQFLTIPNVAADPAGLQQTASFIMDLMKRNGIEQVQTLPAKTPGVPPSVYGEVLVPGATQTIVFYAHYDGQPVNAANWQKGYNLLFRS